jgi:hypothetical protein
MFYTRVIINRMLFRDIFNGICSNWVAGGFFYARSLRARKKTAGQAPVRRIHFLFINNIKFDL